MYVVTVVPTDMPDAQPQYGVAVAVHWHRPAHELVPLPDGAAAPHATAHLHDAATHRPFGFATDATVSVLDAVMLDCWHMSDDGPGEGRLTVLTELAAVHTYEELEN